MAKESDLTMPLDPADLAEVMSMPRKLTLPPPLPPSVPVPGGAVNDVEGFDTGALDDLHLMQWLQGELSSVSEPTRAARMHFELGMLHERAGEPDQACEHFQRAHVLAPDDVASVRAARRLLCSLDKYDDALPLFEAELPRAGSAEARARLLYERGRLLEAQLGRADDALESYRAGLVLTPRDLDLLRAAARIERSHRRWQELDRTLETLAGAIESDAAYRAQVLTERARIADLHLRDPERSLELYQAARDADADVLGATEALRRLGHGQGQWGRTLEALRLEASLSADVEVRAAAHARCAELCVHPLGDLDQAAVALEAAVKELPFDTERLWQLADVYEQAERPADFTRILDLLRGLARSAEEQADLAQQIGFVCEVRQQDLSLAEKYYRAALESVPGHRPALRSLGHLYQSTGDHPALLALVSWQAEGETDTLERAALHVRAGGLVERVGGEAEVALHHFRLALSLDPTQLTALRALDRILPRLGRFEELAQVYEEMVDHATDDAQAVDYLFRLGALREDRLDDPTGAAHAYERVLRRSSGHTGALHALQRVATASGDHALLVRSLEEELALREPSPRWALLGLRIAELYAEVLGDPPRALTHLAAILAHDAQYPQARALMARVYRSERRWDDLVRMLGEELKRMPDSKARTALAYELGSLCESELGRVDEAVGHYVAALEASPRHRPAFAALSRLYEREGRWEPLIKLLEARAESVEQARDRAHLAVRRGQLWEGPLGDPEQAQLAYTDALVEAPGFPAALDARCRLLARQERHAELAQVLSEQAEFSSDPRRWQQAQLWLATLQADVLDDARAAEQTLLRVLEKQPALLPALRDLEAIYVRDADRQLLARVYAAEANVVADEALRAAVLRDLAHAHWTAAETTSEVEAAFERLLALRPADREALEALEASARLRGDVTRVLHTVSSRAALEQDRGATAAHRLLRAQLLEANGRSREALDAYRAALSLQPDSLVAIRGLARTALRLKDPEGLREAAEGDARLTSSEALSVDLLLAAAAVRRKQGDLEGSARDAEAALHRAPEEPRAETALAAALEPRGENARLADLLARAADRATDAERKAELFLRAAMLRAPTDVQSAIADCERALTARPDHERALGKLAAYLERAGEWVRAADTLARVAELSADPIRRAEAQLSLAEIVMERLHDPERALPQLRKVLENRPNDRRALTLQGKLHAQAGEMEQACEVAQRLVEATSDPKERAAALLGAAQLLQRCEKHDEAERALLEALVIEGHEGEAARVYRARLREQKGSWRAYAQALARYLQAATARGECAADAVRAVAEVQLRELGSAEHALKSLMAGIGRWPEELGLHVDYANVLQALAEHDQALQVYREKLTQHPDSPALWRGLSSVHRACGRSDEALSTALPLLLFEGAADELLLELKARNPRPAGAQPGTLNDALLQALDPERVLGGPGVDLVSELTATLSKVQATDLSRYGVARRDRIERDSESGLWEVVDSVAGLLGLTAEHFELYVHDLPEDQVGMVLTEPPALLVPRTLATRPTATLVFALGVPMFLLSQGLAPLASAEPDALLPLLAGAVRRQRDGFASGLCDEAQLEEAARTMAKAVPWLSRKKVEEAIARFGDTSAEDLHAWMVATRRCAARVALLLSDDPVGSLQVLASAGNHGMLQDPLSRELLSFWAGEAACLYRSRY